MDWSKLFVTISLQYYLSNKFTFGRLDSANLDNLVQNLIQNHLDRDCLFQVHYFLYSILSAIFFFNYSLFLVSFGDLITPLGSNLVLRLIRSIYFTAQILSLFLNIIRNFLGNLRMFRRFARSSSIIRKITGKLGI